VKGDGLIPGGSHRYPGRQYRVPPSLRHLDPDLVARTLFETDGNISAAAKILEVDSADLRQFARAKPELIALVDELLDCRLDDAEAKITQAIHSDDMGIALRASMFLLSHHKDAFERGWCSPQAWARANVNVAVNVAPTRYFWADGTELLHREPPAEIDAAPVDEALVTTDPCHERLEIASADKPPKDDMPADNGPPDEPPDDWPPTDNVTPAR
jgi:hypothetical protein